MVLISVMEFFFFGDNESWNRQVEAHVVEEQQFTVANFLEATRQARVLTESQAMIDLLGGCAAAHADR